MNRNVLYIAKPRGDELRGTNQSDKRKDETVKVNNKNLKFGKAQDIEIRGKQYTKDVGDTDLKTIVCDDDYKLIEQLEKNILKVVDKYRMISPKNRKLEWLERISYEKLEDIVREEHRKLKVIRDE